MDLTRWLLRRAAPSAFVVTAVGGTGARLAVERVLRERGWAQALAPAEADLLMVCGPRHRDLVGPVDRVWDQLPGPRARVRVDAPEVAARRLDEARAELRDVARQRRDAEQRDRATHSASPTASGHNGDMMMPGGVPMADRAEDRDGLMLDQLHIALGPALPDWPSGLSLRLVIQGDVVQDAEASTVGEPTEATVAYWDAPVVDADGHPDSLRARAAGALDSMQRLLSVAGWPSAALSGRRLRDALLSTDPQTLPPRDLVRWLRRVRRSRMLRWSTNGLGEITGDTAAWMRGDATDRWSRWLDEVEFAAVAEGGGAAPPPDPRASAALRAQSTRAALRLLPSLLIGQELAAVRLIVASVDPDLGTLTAGDREGSHG
ncbi:hypothetical protein [Allosalinactinospora lopnorensis]|uniref:hypothetical protein n=1 Tax=Allosalinactinospora lopnorensis TaxID=1352348 RepID=UPI000623C3DD|nr:hypothetical protein [Allosalinactinospora lopnorensis]